MRGKHLLQLFLAALLLFGTACGGETGDGDSASEPTAAADSTTRAAPPTTAAPTTGAPATTTTAAATVTEASATTAPAPTTKATVSEFPVTVAGTEIPARPVSIVSMSPTATEILFAIGAGDQVVAVDGTSDHPPEAPMTDLNAFQPNLEAIASYEPDLVVISWDPGEIVSGLEALGVPALVQAPAADIDDAYTQMRQLGEATGHGPAAEALVASIQVEIAELVSGITVPDEPLTYYHEVDNTFYSATSATFIGNVYALFGLENIADASDPDGFGYPQLSGEYILEADPDIIFFGCAIWCGTSAESIAERPGWSGLRAVRNGVVIEVDDDISSRWGPRLVQFVELIGETLATLPEGDR